MDQKLVSVNITTYNRAHLLPRCLGSVLSQSYRNLEIIVVDDSSFDHTEEVVHQYQKNDQRIKYCKHKTNKGNAHARNTALKNCNGYYVAFMDDDDEWIDNDKIQKQVNIFENASDNLAIICSNVILIDKKGNHKEKLITPPKNLKNHILGGNGIIYSPTVMTKRNIMKEVGGFDEKLPRGVDSDFYRICIIKHNYDVYFMSEITTAIHVYGEDRITPSMGLKDRVNIIKANSYLIYKYFNQYMYYPKPLFLRLKAIIKTIIFNG